MSLTAITELAAQQGIPRGKLINELLNPDQHISAERVRAYQYAHEFEYADCIDNPPPVGNGERPDHREWRQLSRTVFQRDGYTCTYCGQEEPAQPHCDHIVPVSRGGSNDIENLTTACQFCNCSKHDKMPNAWRPFSWWWH